MKVLLACDILKYAFGGVRYYIHELADHLSRLPGVELTIFAERPEDVASLPAHLPRHYIEFGRTPFRTVNYLAVSRRHFLPYDIVHFPFSNVYLAMSWAMLTGVRPKTVVTVHDLIPLVMREYHTPLLMAFYKLWMPRILARASAVLTTSHYTSADILRHYNVRPEKLVVNYNGLNRRFKSVVPTAEKQPFFLAVSTVEPRKNFVRTIQAFLRFRELHPEWQGTLKIVGKLDPNATALMTLAKQNADAVQMLGSVSDDELAELYQTATALLYPSLYEGFGLPVLEGMAVGCPVVTSNTTSIPEVGGNAVVYVDPTNVESIAEGIRRVAFDAPLRAELVTRGLAQSKQFSWERCAAEIGQVYHDVASGKRRR